MIQRPRPLGLMLCDQVIFEGGTNKPSLIGVFTGIACSQFPSLPRSFDVFAALTDGQGEGIFNLSITHLDTDQEISEQKLTLLFPNSLKVINFRFRFRTLTFPAAGMYLFELFAEEEPLCHQRIRVYLSEASQ